MKYLCVCERGNCRSVTLAWLLKDIYNENALAAGTTANGPQTMALLYEWADRILITDARLVEKVPAAQLDKMRLLDVGPDRWGQPMHPDLRQRFEAMLAAGRHH